MISENTWKCRILEKHVRKTYFLSLGTDCLLKTRLVSRFLAAKKRFPNIMRTKPYCIHKYKYKGCLYSEIFVLAIQYPGQRG
jgi:hypothetical protein